MQVLYDQKDKDSLNMVKHHHHAPLLLRDSRHKFFLFQATSLHLLSLKSLLRHATLIKKTFCLQDLLSTASPPYVDSYSHLFDQNNVSLCATNPSLQFVQQYSRPRQHNQVLRDRLFYCQNYAKVIQAQLINTHHNQVHVTHFLVLFQNHQLFLLRLHFDATVLDYVLTVEQCLNQRLGVESILYFDLDQPDDHPTLLSIRDSTQNCIRTYLTDLLSYQHLVTIPQIDHHHLLIKHIKHSPRVFRLIFLKQDTIISQSFQWDAIKEECTLIDSIIVKHGRAFVESLRKNGPYIILSDIKQNLVMDYDLVMIRDHNDKVVANSLYCSYDHTLARLLVVKENNYIEDTRPDQSLLFRLPDTYLIKAFLPSEGEVLSLVIAQESYEQQKLLNLMIVVDSHLDAHHVFQLLFRRVARCILPGPELISALDLTEFVLYLRQNQQNLKDIILLAIKANRSQAEHPLSQFLSQYPDHQNIVRRVLLNLLLISQDTPGQKDIIKEVKSVMLHDAYLPAAQTCLPKSCPYSGQTILHQPSILHCKTCNELYLPFQCPAQKGRVLVNSQACLFCLGYLTTIQSII